MVMCVDISAKSNDNEPISVLSHPQQRGRRALIGMFFWETGVILCAFYARCNAKPPLPFQNTKKTRVILSPFYPPLPKLSERHHAKTPKKTLSS
jgi:hypothetical protein